jgi:ATP-dependent exoDNAse (exonuclease V) beta subunit
MPKQQNTAQNALPLPPELAPVADSEARQRALDISTSFIVRAPAGSGKTRLLIQRYLALLAVADEPEEVVAITFTRKAAAEMRARVMSALSQNEAVADVDQDTRALAKRALARDTERGWNIVASSQRLRIQTIDSLNASLTRQMPMTSRFGAQPESIDDASALYLEAARRLLSKIYDPRTVAEGAQVEAGVDSQQDTQLDDIAILLAHLDNNLGVAEQLIADMLRSRDHWLRNLPRMHEREALEGALGRVRARATAAVARQYPEELKNETLALVRFSGQNLLEQAVDSALSRGAELAAFPGTTDLAAWQAIAELLLTREGTWRKPRGINKTVGFPTSTDKTQKAALDAMKARVGEMLTSLADAPSANPLAAALQRLREVPPATYRDAEWEVLGAIVRLLPYATAILWQVFGAKGQCDFTEIAQAASRALGTEDEPTDLALSLDYRICHLLVDEFQDTSFAQFELLEKLTSGWSQGDGRTLFVVGDPMQSIYRFREAEVGLFTRASESGIGGVALEPVSLSVNFRSTPAVVDWVNGVFSVLMPTTAAAEDGGVTYSPSQSSGVGATVTLPAATTPEANSGAVVQWQVVAAAAGPDALPFNADIAEAHKVVSLIDQTRAQSPAATIAILVRNRSHLNAIVPALKSAGIRFQAVDIDPLKNRPVVQDLLALTRALLHPADGIAWLSLLRARWCGLTLDELALLMDGRAPTNGKLTPDARLVWDVLNDDARFSALAAESADGAARVLRFRHTVAHALSRRSRTTLRELVEQTWLALGGPACVDANALSDADAFLSLLDTEATAQGSGGSITDLARLEARMEKMFAGSSQQIQMVDGEPNGSPPVQIMTIHKAKGLEFDTVIVPGLHRTPRNDDKRLLVWAEQPDPATGERELLLAPIREASQDDGSDEIYRYIAALERTKQHQEDVRLLYVASTRAERQLHLLATVSVKADEATLVPPRGGSLLAAIWPALPADSLPAPHAEAPSGAGGGLQESNTRARRLPTTILSPALPSPLQSPCGLSNDTATTTAATQAAANESQPAIDFDWASDAVRHVGTVVHAMLQRIAEDGVAQWSASRVAACQPFFDHELMRRGVDADTRRAAIPKIAKALTRTLQDPRGRWLLESHRDARAEWRITGAVSGQLVNAVIDRTFVDADGVRWIVDFKSGSHEGADIDAFLDNEQRRYRQQLETYATLVRGMSIVEANRVIKLALYFPLLGGWREWLFGAAN